MDPKRAYSVPRSIKVAWAGLASSHEPCEDPNLDAVQVACSKVFGQDFKEGTELEAVFEWTRLHQD